ncbi:hypothetical protein OGR47_01415 [Methylocystis sp. MJC1]|jgi:hypothetical protein|uniref:hypothetical protein n=1 Tax=Methylocystis sp. MJC1 TaxID=2654282 RepID=UPI0013ED4F06|nr:hypothetical protein [Methylocystis sp. MJC1]KAF2988896.1 hypothetical protein MJC1_04026 [Methylocystis sp. MJC1]MBU6525671.1 hypothetical protein [Methylocystis sp. MJC1]UZX12144.1 hypothetical protein OGR47_01415 [Methylocystis sp. MJC1]
MRSTRKTQALRAARNPSDVIRSAEPLDRKQAAILVLFEAMDLIDDQAASELVRFAVARLVCESA